MFVYRMLAWAQLYHSFWDVGPSYTAAFYFSQPRITRGFASCRPSAYTALGVLQPSNSAYPTALIASLLVSIRPLPPQLIGSFRLRLI